MKLPVVEQRESYVYWMQKEFKEAEPGRNLRFRASAATKLMGRGVLCAWSLPAGPMFTCPGATPLCAKACYAQTGRFVRFRPVVRVSAENWKRWIWYEKREDMDGCVAELSALVQTPMFRIHESGDFHSQWSVDVWTEVVKQHPNVWFWAYTRSFMFDYSKLLRLRNFRLWASADTANMKQAKAFSRKYRKVRLAMGPWNVKEPLPENTFICPVTKDHYREEGAKEYGVDGACERCRACLPNFGGRSDKGLQKDVVFLTHGKIALKEQRIYEGERA